MKVLAASIVHQRPDIFSRFLASLAQQQTPDGVRMETLIVIDRSDPNAETNARMAAAAGATVIDALPKPDGARYAVNEVSHDWSVPTFHWLAQNKQRILDRAFEDKTYDAVFLVDSDLILDPTTLWSLLSTEKEIVSAVFWTRWTPDAPPLPQVWRTHPYEFQDGKYEAHEFLSLLARRQLVDVGGLGACTLIRQSTHRKAYFWPLQDGLPTHGMWQGEDRHFCVAARRSHIELWADAWPDIQHLYRPSEIASETAPAVPEAVEVSLFIEPLEEPRLPPGHKEFVRGRLGSLPLLPGIENVVASMVPGDERIITIRFPVWYPISDYRGQHKTLRVKLLFARPYVSPPNTEDVVEHFLHNG